MKDSEGQIEMPKFKAEVPHQLSREEAVQRLQGFLPKIEEMYKDQVSKMESEWTDDVLNFALTTYGFTISGELAVDDEKAHLNGKLPMAAMAFRGKIEKTISRALESALS